MTSDLIYQRSDGRLRYIEGARGNWIDAGQTSVDLANMRPRV